MPRRYDLETLVARCKRRADKENDEHISDAEWAALLSEAYGELYDIVSGTNLRYFETVHEFTADGSDSYDEPDDHGKTVGLDRVDSDGTRFTLRPLMAQERIRFAGRTRPPPDAQHVVLLLKSDPQLQAERGVRITGACRRAASHRPQARGAGEQHPGFAGDHRFVRRERGRRAAFLQLDVQKLAL